MAKTVYLSCEVCGEWDSAGNRVVTVTVCGHRVELCKLHRVQLLMQLGVSEEHAVAFSDAISEKFGKVGTNPTMAQIAELFAERAPAVELPESSPEPAQEELVSAGAVEDTEVETAPARKRR